MQAWILVATVLLSLLNQTGRILAQDAAEITTTSESTAKVELPLPVIERSSQAHVHVDPTLKGFWTKKLAWRPRWVKTWQEKKIHVAVWKRMWGPMVMKEWVPVPKPPPGWVKHDAGSYVVKKFPHL